MKIIKEKFFEAAKKTDISEEQADKLWNELDQCDTSQNTRLTYIIFYIGLLLISIATYWFAEEIWDRYHGKGLFFTALLYSLSSYSLGSILWSKSNLKIPGGILITLAIAFVPVAVYGLQDWFGVKLLYSLTPQDNLYTWVTRGWCAVEISTIIAATLALNFYSFSFLTTPMLFMLWMMAIDLWSLAVPGFPAFTKASMSFGLAVLIASYILERRGKSKIIFWPYIIGAAALWYGLSMTEFSTEYERFIYLLLNIALIFLSALIHRIIFLIFGMLGIILYFTWIFQLYFAESLSFSFFIGLMGLLTLLLGMILNKKLYRT